jgi:hypothetical protein
LPGDREGWTIRVVAAVEDLLIVGGGIGGMSLAVAVQGAGIHLTAPSLRALRTLGLLDRCIPAGWSVYRQVRGTVEGDVIDLGPAPGLLGPGYPASLGITRPVFHRIPAGPSWSAARSTWMLSSIGTRLTMEKRPEKYKPCISR